MDPVTRSLAACPATLPFARTVGTIAICAGVAATRAQVSGVDARSCFRCCRKAAQQWAVSEPEACAGDIHHPTQLR